MKAFHIPKTIDNDLLETDHCPGYGSAARFVAHAFQGDDADNLVVVIMEEVVMALWAL